MWKFSDDLGRFTSVDPLWEEFRGWSPYQYGYNNPLMVTDPSGMQGLDIGVQFGMKFQELMITHPEDMRQIGDGALGVIGGVSSIAGGIVIAGGSGGLALAFGGGLIVLGVPATGLGFTKMSEGFGNILTDDKSGPDIRFSNTGQVVGFAIDQLAGTDIAEPSLGMGETLVTSIGGLAMSPVSAGANGDLVDMYNIWFASSQVFYDGMKITIEAIKNSQADDKSKPSNSTSRTTSRGVNSGGGGATRADQTSMMPQ